MGHIRIAVLHGIGCDLAVQRIDVEQGKGVGGKRQPQILQGLRQQRVVRGSGLIERSLSRCSYFVRQFSQVGLVGDQKITRPVQRESANLLR